MRLIYVSHSFPPAGKPLENVGGMQRVATELHKALYRHPDISLDTLILRSTWTWTHFRTPFFLISCWFQLSNTIRDEDVDVVLFSSMVTATLALPLQKIAREHDVRLVAIAHGRDVTLPVMPYQWLVPRVFDSLDAVFPISSATETACIERGVPPCRTHVIPNGVDVSRFGATPALRKKARQKLLASTGTSSEPLTNDDIILFSVGRQIERKGFEWFIRNVMPALPDHVHYWLAGDGPEEENIQEAISELGFTRRVRLMGRVSERELDSLYHGADLFVMPNIRVQGDMEGFGIVMLEAGQCGLPTVASKIEGITDVIAEGQNGHLIEESNAQEFADAILRYVNDRSALEQASKRAATYVRQTFNWTKVGERYFLALQDVISRSKREPVHSGQ